MSSDNEKLTFRNLIEKVIEPTDAENGTGYLHSSYLTSFISLVEAFHSVQEQFSRASSLTILLTLHGKELHAGASTTTPLANGQPLPDLLPFPIEELAPFLANDGFIGEGNRLNSLPFNLVRFIHQAGLFSLALIPIDLGGKILAVILHATTEQKPLDNSILQNLRELAHQISLSIQSVEEAQRTKVTINEMTAASRLGSLVTHGTSEKQIYDAVRQIFEGASDSIIMLQAEGGKLKVAYTQEIPSAVEPAPLPQSIEVPPAFFSAFGEKVLAGGTEQVLAQLESLVFEPLSTEGSQGQAEDKLSFLNGFIRASQFKYLALIPINNGEALTNLMVWGTKADQPLPLSIEALYNIKNLVAEAFSRLRNEQALQRRLSEDEAIISIGQEINSIRELPLLYQSLHANIRQTMGNVNFLVAIYEQLTDSISIPYMYETGPDGNETIVKIDSFPLGEGLTSIIIKTQKPLMILEDTERQAAALGAKIIGRSARSWLGTPIIIGDEVIGAIIVQDLEREFAFDDNDLRFLNSLSSRVAGAIYNTRLLDETRHRAIQLQTAAEIARDISGLLDIGELLNKAVTLIRERFNFYHAAVFLVDQQNEFAQIRAATGEAGTQMKRAGHKLKVGSKSIVGFVTSSGEPLIVNDTTRDATYFANPLLPDTHAEVAIPLMIGQRIMGALDVQSTQVYSFSKEDISVLRILADQMAIAVINSELFADTQEHLSKSRLLHHVTTTAASGTTLEEALDGAVQGLQVTLGGDRVSILLADQENKVLTIKSYVGYSEEIGNLRISYENGLTGWAASHQQSIRVNDVSRDPRYIQGGSNVCSELAVPLLYRGELLGVLNVESDNLNAFNENDEELIGTLGGSLAAVIANARLVEQVRRQVDREHLLYEVTSKIRRSHDIQSIITSTAAELNKALGAQRTSIKMGIAAGNAGDTAGQNDQVAGEIK